LGQQLGDWGYFSEELEKQLFALMMEIINLKEALLPLINYFIQP
jgi:hypothetical protein